VVLADTIPQGQSGLDVTAPTELELAFFEPTHAYTGKDKFYIRFLAGGNVFYGSGLQPDLEEGKSDYDPGTYIARLDNVQVEEWDDLPDNATSITVLSQEDWLEAMEGFSREIIPEGGREGIVFEFLEQKEYFFYFDNDGNLQTTLLEEKPPEIGISKVYTHDEFIELVLSHLRKVLAGTGLPEPAFLVRLPDRGAFSFPFMYVDIDHGILAFVQLISDDQVADSLYHATKARSLWHMGVSFLGMVVRPFTAIHQLFMLPLDSIQDTVMPNSLGRVADVPIPELYDGPGMDLGEFEKILDEVTMTESSSGTVEYLIDGKAFFPRFLDAFNKAEKSIDLRTYIFDNDDYAHKVANVLKDRDANGVRVRVLLDGLPTIGHQKPKKEKLPEGYTSPSTIYGYMEDDSKVSVRLRPNTWLSLDHSKTTIVDRETAFIGGMNIGKEYRYAWHDMMMELKGPVVGDIQYRFNKAWAISGWLGDFASAYVQGARKPTVEPTGKDYPIRILLSSQGDSDIYWGQLAAIDNAKRYIYIENAYFADNHILYRLVQARRRGVDVRVILPAAGNWGSMNVSNKVTANRMLENGIRVYLYPGMSHIKAAVFDGWACIGSANFDRASFRLNVETNIATSHPVPVQGVLDTLFTPDFEVSEEITELFPETWEDRFIEALANQM
jgi:cardiolipin synthase